jgi:hypothetical protein
MVGGVQGQIRLKNRELVKVKDYKTFARKGGANYSQKAET